MTRVWVDTPQKNLSDSERLNNAQMVANHFVRDTSDWTPESIAAMCGNMYYESSLNPNMLEFDSVYNQGWTDDQKGFGLVQWTPSKKLKDWCAERGLNYRDGDVQLARIEWEVDTGTQWITNRLPVAYGVDDHSYNITFKQFRTNAFGWSVEQLAKAFLWNYEGPNYYEGRNGESVRGNQARYYLNSIDWVEAGSTTAPDPTPPPPPIDGGTEPHPPYDNPNQLGFTQFVSDLDGLTLVDVGQDNYYSNPMLSLVKVGANTYQIKVNQDKVREYTLKPYDPPPQPEPVDPDPTIPPDPGGGQVDPDPTGLPNYPVDMSNHFISSRYATANPSRPNHSGLDLAPNDGEVGKWPIYTVHDGTVTFVNNGCPSRPGSNLGDTCGGTYGNNVRIRHCNDSYSSLYAHMHNVIVQVGQVVSQGQQIGTVGNSGNSTGAHVHLEISKTGNFGPSQIGRDLVDPEQYLQGNL